ncbi:hypothetical protein ACN9MU_17465 [Pseudoduganella sp. R-32]|uniref:hypothetical protein n=1 Tax=Pseudoduganella sp. R-32 TaxID=3404061 RepID=UPI003CF0FA32
MVRSNKKRVNKAVDPRKIKADRIATELRVGGMRRANALFSLKMKNDIPELMYYLKSALRNRDIYESFHGSPFPQRIDKLFSVPAYGRPASPQVELMWGLYRASLFKDELSEFTRLRNKFERCVILDLREDAQLILTEIEDKFGVSLWLIQNRLSLAQVWSGLEEKRQLAGEYLSAAPSSSLPRLFISFISKRSEATGLKNYLQDEIARFFGESTNSYFEAYVRTKLFELGQYSTSNIAPTLLFEAQSSLIDHYETLILTLQSVAIDEDLPNELGGEILKFIKYSLGIEDCRIRAIERTLNPRYVITVEELQGPRARIIDAYSAGVYHDVINSGAAYLLESPDDISVCALMAKAIVATESEVVSLPGYLGELVRLFTRLFEFRKDTYGAAFAIYTIHDRFYGHSWAVIARAIMSDALARETTEFPSAASKYVLSIDRFISPFTALSLSTAAKVAFCKNSDVSSAFPITNEILNALVVGVSSSKVDGPRLERYLARHNLAAGNYQLAAIQFSSLMNIGTASERFRAAACAALAYLAMGQVAKAVDAVVFGALINKEVPIVLPIPEVVAQLESVENWPDSISLPILFELYSAYFGEDKLTHLKFSFERYQLANNIERAEDFSNLIDKIGKDRVIAYLDRVWRPEIMRQTLLYETPKETEDARIAVCRVLASLDPENSYRYQEEIRDRVKRQEIAKGTTLVEQSKVYVDIIAIKKTLNAKLGDTYTRYKGATQSNPNQQDQVMEKLADLVSDNLSKNDTSLTNILSSLHVLDYKESELDLQFSALFSEVTNEFLRGDHGLNAYLSTRVRHGTLANTLRKPLADEHLVTALKEDESGYLPNTNWDTDLEVLDLDERQHVTEALDDFTRTFDDIIQHVRDRLIQIRIHHDIPSKSDKDEALFVYKSSNLERKYVQEFDKKVSNIEQFIDRCIESLWEKTDVNLTTVRETLRDKVRTDFLESFDRLADKINHISDQQAVSGLINAMARARTNFLTKFNIVQTWFNRNEVYDRQDYSPEYAAQIALNMVQKTIPNGNHDLQVEISMGTSGALMPGRTLDAMVDVFACLLDNASIRSGLPTDLLRIKVELLLQDGKFSALVANNIAAEKPTPADLEKVTQVRESLTKSDSRARAQREGGSGFHKIWRAITSPIYKDPYFWFGFSDNGQFEAIIRYNIEQDDNEDTSD